jgi:RNA polymerase sigma-70 factor, ECF subfamily
MVEDEALLIRRAQLGDKHAFETLVEPLVAPAYRFAYGMLFNREAAEDAVQEAALKAWRKIGNVREGWSIRPWFFAIVANHCRSERSSRWWSVLTLDLPPRAEPADDDVIVRGADLRRALRGLPVSRREAIVLHYYLDLPLEEVAAVLRLPIGTVKSRIHRGLEQMRPYLELAGEVSGEVYG